MTHPHPVTPAALIKLVRAAEKAGKVVERARVLPAGEIVLEFAGDTPPTNPADLVDMSE